MVWQCSRWNRRVQSNKNGVNGKKFSTEWHNKSRYKLFNVSVCVCVCKVYLNWKATYFTYFYEFIRSTFYIVRTHTKKSIMLLTFNWLMNGKSWEGLFLLVHGFLMILMTCMSSKKMFFHEHRMFTTVYVLIYNDFSCLATGGGAWNIWSICHYTVVSKVSISVS